MKRPVLFALGVPTIAGMFVWAGCALVIDLGDEATVRPADASTDSTNPVDSGGTAIPEAGPPALVCGLPPLKNEKCATCSAGSCCDVNTACGADPECVRGLECIQNCLAQYACINSCAPDNVALKALVKCSSEQCGECTPNSDCQALGACASLLDPDGGNVLREVAKQLILKLDGEECRKQRLIIGQTLDAAVCN